MPLARHLIDRTSVAGRECVSTLRLELHQSLLSSTGRWGCYSNVSCNVLHPRPLSDHPLPGYRDTHLEWLAASLSDLPRS